MSSSSRIFDGWLTSYKINRPLNRYESEVRLEIGKPTDLFPIDIGILKLNSVYIEYMDRYFLVRGWAATWSVPITLICLYFTWLFGSTIYSPLQSGKLPSGEQILDGWFAVVLFVSAVVWLCCFGLLKDFFCYTHYPIRFNRITRKVYVFCHNGPDGVVEVDWETAYWFVGKTRDEWKDIYDLRCHLLDAEGIIRHTFAVAHIADNRAEILQHWEMIRRYMEESPTALPFPPLHLFFCTEPTLWNAFVIQLGAVNAGKSPLLLVFGSIWGFFRWISQKTCRTPRWPAHVEAVCQIPPNDPYRQPEPWRMGQILGMTEEDERKSTEYTLQAKAAAQAYELANPPPPNG